MLKKKNVQIGQSDKATSWLIQLLFVLPLVINTVTVNQ